MNLKGTAREGTNSQSDTVGDKLSQQRGFRMCEITILASVVIAIIVFGMLNPRFIGIEPAMAILEGASSDGLMVIGMTVVIVCGAFDMSVGSQMAACGLVAAVMMKAGALRWAYHSQLSFLWQEC